MTKIELELDEQTLEQAQRLAAAHHYSLEAWLKQIIEQSVIETAEDPLLGMFADEPELIDQIVAIAMQDREEVPLRSNYGQSPA